MNNYTPEFLSAVRACATTLDQQEEGQGTLDGELLRPIFDLPEVRKEIRGLLLLGTLFNVPDVALEAALALGIRVGRDAEIARRDAEELTRMVRE